jgi:hypothetical protein
MIAMQYSFVFPADYDMSVIDRRIAGKGHMTDGWPGLVFKAYLSSRKSDAGGPASENRYAPFYLWQSPAAMNDFLCGPPFAGLTQSFGWPSVQSWLVWDAALGPELAGARFASRESIPIRPHTRLDELKATELGLARERMEQHGALAAVIGFEPSTWNVVRFHLWAQLPAPGLLADGCLYDVGHISAP